MILQHYASLESFKITLKTTRMNILEEHTFYALNYPTGRKIKDVYCLSQILLIEDLQKHLHSHLNLTTLIKGKYIILFIKKI